MFSCIGVQFVRMWSILLVFLLFLVHCSCPKIIFFRKVIAFKVTGSLYYEWM